jgi:hypothetical protein
LFLTRLPKFHQEIFSGRGGEIYPQHSQLFDNPH